MDFLYTTTVLRFLTQRGLPQLILPAIRAMHTCSPFTLMMTTRGKGMRMSRWVRWTNRLLCMVLILERALRD